MTSTEGLERKLKVDEPVVSVTSQDSYPKQWTVQEGETNLQQVASDWLGHPEAATEIALYNGLTPNQTLTPRTVLNLPPLLSAKCVISQNRTLDLAIAEH